MLISQISTEKEVAICNLRFHETPTSGIRFSTVSGGARHREKNSFLLLDTNRAGGRVIFPVPAFSLRCSGVRHR